MLPFPSQKLLNQNKGNRWITPGIITSCKRKRELFLIKRSTNNPPLNRYYKKYCNVSAKIIREAKKMTYNSKIAKVYNKTRTTWNIVNEL